MNTVKSYTAYQKKIQINKYLILGEIFGHILTFEKTDIDCYHTFTNLKNKLLFINSLPGIL